MKRKGYIALFLAAVLLLGLCACSNEPTDPYEGMVQVETGYGSPMWIRPYEGVPVNELKAEDFVDGQYVGDAYDVKMGIDVSEHQKIIDWGKVAADGIDFAIIRAGYRGYSVGGIFADEYFHDNLTGAAANGLDIGVYFFSQATTVEEAEEEAEYLVSLLQSYPANIVTLPVFYDWETIGTEPARTDGVGGETITDCALAFTSKIE